MSTYFLASILDTLRKEYSNIPVKVEIFMQNKERITRITLKDTSDSDPPTWKISKTPVEKKSEKEKSQSY